MDMPIPSALYAPQIKEGGQSCSSPFAIPQEDYVLTLKDWCGVNSDQVQLPLASIIIIRNTKEVAI